MAIGRIAERWTVGAANPATAIDEGVEGIEDQGQFFNKQGVRTPNDPRGFRQREMAAFAQDSYNDTKTP